MVAAAGDGLVVEVGGPGAGGGGSLREVAEGVAELLVGSPRKVTALTLLDWRVEGDSGQAGQGVAGVARAPYSLSRGPNA